MVPEVGVHDSKLIMCKARGKYLVTIQGLRPSITDRGRGGVPLCSHITTGSGGRDKGVGGRHLGEKGVVRDGKG